MSKVLARLVSVRLGRFMVRRGVLPTNQFANRKGSAYRAVLEEIWRSRVQRVKGISTYPQLLENKLIDYNIYIYIQYIVKVYFILVKVIWIKKHFEWEILCYLIIIIIIKKRQQCKVGESDIHPISPKTPAPQYQPIDRKKRNGKKVEDYSRDRAA